MKGINNILVPTDLSEHSRRGIHGACSLAADANAALIVLHVANQYGAWELYADEFSFLGQAGPRWTVDRVIQEASLAMNHYLEQHFELLKNCRAVTKRVVLGPIPHRIAQVAQEENIDLIVMSPRRHRGLTHLFTGNITDRVMRMSPCPVVSNVPLPSEPWRGRLCPILLGWPRPKVATL